MKLINIVYYLFCKYLMKMLIKINNYKILFNINIMLTIIYYVMFKLNYTYQLNNKTISYFNKTYTQFNNANTINYSNISNNYSNTSSNKLIIEEEDYYIKLKINEFKTKLITYINIYNNTNLQYNNNILNSIHKYILLPVDHTQLIDNLIKLILSIKKDIFKLIFIDKYKNCGNSLLSELNNFKSNFNLLYFILYSGSASETSGKRQQCEAMGRKYILIDSKIDPYLYHTSQRIIELALFLSSPRFFNGICVNNECHDMLVDLLNINNYENKDIMDFLYSYGIYNIKVFKTEDVEFVYTNRTKVFKILLLIYFIYVLIKLIYTFISEIIIRHIINKEALNIENALELNSFDNNNNSSIDSELTDSSYVKSKSTYLIGKYVIKETRLKSFLLYYNEYFNYKNNLKDLFVLKNSYYNQSNLLFISVIRLYVLVLITLLLTFYSMLQLPQKDKNSDYFITGLSFIIVKLSSYSITSFVILEGISFGFKFMNYIADKSKFNNTSDFSFSLKDAIKFIIKSCSRFISFYFVLSIFYLSIREIGNYLNNSQMLLFFQKLYFESMSCFINPYKIYIPFINQYSYCNGHNINIPLNNIVNNNNNISYDNSYLFSSKNNVDKYDYKYNSYQDYGCFSAFSMGHNLLFSIICITFISYISMKIRKKAFDYIILAIVLGFTNMLYYYYKEIDNTNNFPQKTNIRIILGDKLSLIQLHVFFCYYYIGYLIGVTLFYNKDIIDNPVRYTELNFVYFNNKINNTLESMKLMINNKKELINNNNNNNNNNKSNNKSNNLYINTFDKAYIPYIFCYNLMRITQNLNKCFRVFILCICLIIILLLSSSFYIQFNVKKKIYFETDIITRLLYCYEKLIFTYCLSILIVLFNIGDNFKSIVNTWQSTRLVFIERISFNYFIILESLIFVLFTMFMIDFRTNLFNVLFFTCCSFVSCLFISIIITIDLEIPLRVFLKGNVRTSNKTNY